MEMFPVCHFDVPKQGMGDEVVFCVQTANGTYKWDSGGGASLVLNDKILKHWPGRPKINDIVNNRMEGIEGAGCYVRFFQNGEIIMRWDKNYFHWGPDIPWEKKVYNDSNRRRYWMTA
jgi:hypothetical protein